MKIKNCYNLILNRPRRPEYYACTDTGKKYAQNEDFFLLPESHKKYRIGKIDKKGRGYLFILCDGIGGENAGEVASELTATWLFKEYYYATESTGRPEALLEKAILKVNEKVFMLSCENTQYQGMGTTLVVVLIIKNFAYINSIGDSRMYLFRANDFRQITEDQSEVWELYRQGEITKDEIRTHPRNNIITMAVGLDKNLAISDINRYRLKVKERDVLLVCSDGLTDMVSDDEIASVLSSKRTLKQKTAHLVDLANANGGRDNITVLLIRI